MTTTSTPGGYTSRFVAHVAQNGQTTAHDEVTSNSSNPRDDRDRFRAFSADGTDAVRPYVPDRGEDVTVTAAVVADRTANADEDARNKPQATYASSARTDGITDTDKSPTTSSTSSHLAITCESPESQLGDSRDDNRVASVASSGDVDATLVEGRSGNDEISVVVAVGLIRNESILATDDNSGTTREREDMIACEKRESDESVFGCLRIVVEDVDAMAVEQPDLASRSIHEHRDRSRSKESQTVSECSSSFGSGQTVSDSDSSSDSESDSEEEEEETEDDDESRDENCNVKNEKKEERKVDGNSGDKDSAGNGADEENKGSSSSEGDEGATVLSVNSSTQDENSQPSDDRHERDLKRRSASIIDERSIEEMFDDNGWVITEQDLQTDLPAATALPGFGSTNDPSEEAADAIGSNDTTETHNEEIIPRIERRGDEISSNLEDSSAQSSTGIDGAGTIPSSERQPSESLPRSRVYRQSSLGKNGWLISDESESESDRTASPIEATSDRGVGTAKMIDRIKDRTGSIDENGWVILDDDYDDDGKDRVADRSAQENAIRSQTTDLVTKTHNENGALVANAIRSKGTEQSGPGEESPGANISIPMQMVTTVFCVSVLCYSVLTNLFL